MMKILEARGPGGPGAARVLVHTFGLYKSAATLPWSTPRHYRIGFRMRTLQSNVDIFATPAAFSPP